MSGLNGCVSTRKPHLACVNVLYYIIVDKFRTFKGDIHCYIVGAQKNMDNHIMVYVIQDTSP